ncbi:MAG: hypothetical protein QME48_04400 [bacterium]|uniref:Uncharacterized protein n=2 Tax=Bacteria candidate phyla TaxID=1783234 RepID=A0A101I212_UNCT6|nr:MAG: hypothetical protein XD76_1038 [candidate division TA06 bacterium 32_111]KUK87288.1 MAG: hypothetical protein XE03_0896 [candidate division TA06 bacterium 34_109]MDI6700454.1 hypothetical protein [bacterium]HAF07578.1 hypothetical protein [candidate division WOR-3 bacterium]
MDKSFQPVSPKEIPLERKEEILKKIAENIVKRSLTAPAIMFLESIKPMNFISAQIMIFLEPIILTFFNIKEYREASLIFEERDSVEKLIRYIEDFENQHKRNKKDIKEDK